MAAMRFVSLSLTLIVSLLILQACDSTPTPCVQKQDSSANLSALQRQRDDTDYEMQLRQTELDQMMQKARGAIGVSNQWLERKNDLTEKITQLQVKEHDLDLQIEAAKK
jgi:hypothetical protein